MTRCFNITRIEVRVKQNQDSRGGHKESGFFIFLFSFHYTVGGLEKYFNICKLKRKIRWGVKNISRHSVIDIIQVYGDISIMFQKSRQYFFETKMIIFRHEVKEN